MIDLPDAAVLRDFPAEVTLAATLLVVVFVGTAAPRPTRRQTLSLAALGLLIALAALVATPPAAEPLWGGWLLADGASIYFRAVILIGAIATVGLLLVSGLAGQTPRPDHGELAILLLAATLGLCLMATANNLLMIYLAVEMASLPGYALVGFRRTVSASEAAAKYAVFGAAAAGVMLYGLSMIYALTGTLNLTGIADLVGQLPDDRALTVAVATVAVLIGLAFKSAAVPLHFWCPDAFEGAAIEVAAFVSVTGKAAAMALLSRFALTLSTADGPASPAGAALSVALLVAAALSMTLGNLAALAQSDLRRLLAYSVVAHAGYMLMAVATLRQPGPDSAATNAVTTATTFTGVEAVMAYTAVYVFMNLGVFAAAVVVRGATGRHDLEAFRGLGHAQPLTAVAATAALMSLAGIPPLAGFLVKFAVFAAVFAMAHPAPGVWQPLALVVLGIALANTVLALFYYARLVGLIWLPPAADAPALPTQPSLMSRLLSLVTLAALLAGTLAWGPLAHLTHRAAADLRTGVAATSSARSAIP